MNFSERDRRTLVAGAVIAVLIIMGTPLFRKWSDMGDRLDNRRAEVARLRESTDGYDALVRRRDVLVSRLGTLLEPEETPDDESDDEAAEAGKEAADAEKPPDASEEPQDASDESKDSEPETNAPDEPGKPPPDNQDAEQEEKATPETQQDAEDTEKPGESEDAAAPPAEKDDAGAKPGGTEEKPEQSGEAGESEKAGGSTGDKKDAEEQETPAAESVAGYVGRVAKESGVKLKRVTPRKTSGSRAAREHFKPATVQVSMEATAENLIKMLHTLEKGGRFARVEQMQLLRNASKGNTIDVSLDVMAYETGEG
jgi:Type II secretion system (T2SS), protein M subtype b